MFKFFKFKIIESVQCVKLSMTLLTSQQGQHAAQSYNISLLFI